MSEPVPTTLPEVLAHLSKRWTPRLDVYGPVIAKIEKHFQEKEPPTESATIGPMALEQKEPTK